MPKKAPPTTVTFAFLALIAANLIWAAAGPVIKLTISFIPPFTFLFLRFLTVCVLVLPYTLVGLSKTVISPKDYWKILILGVFSQSSIIFIVFGLKYTTAV